jgi:hypothetical protein
MPRRDIMESPKNTWLSFLPSEQRRESIVAKDNELIANT